MHAVQFYVTYWRSQFSGQVSAIGARDEAIFTRIKKEINTYPMWPIQQYTKFALATAYFPGSNYEAATRRLCRWILNNKDLYSHLKETGYNKMQHHFTARQTALIFEYLGEP